MRAQERARPVRLRLRAGLPDPAPRVPEVACARVASLRRVEPSPFEVGHAGLVDEALAVDEALWAGENADHSGWFCVRTDPFPCPANGCVFVAEFMTAVHLILVWEQSDDLNLLRHAARAKEVGRNPRITEYLSSYGPSASYYAWEAAGGPVHGVRAP